MRASLQCIGARTAAPVAKFEASRWLIASHARFVFASWARARPLAAAKRLSLLRHIRRCFRCPHLRCTPLSRCRTPGAQVILLLKIRPVVAPTCLMRAGLRAPLARTPALVTIRGPIYRPPTDRPLFVTQSAHCTRACAHRNVNLHLRNEHQVDALRTRFATAAFRFCCASATLPPCFATRTSTLSWCPRAKALRACFAAQA